MTIPEFLAELALTPFKWGGRRWIRTVDVDFPNSPCECPISAVWKVRHPLKRSRPAFMRPIYHAELLGLSKEDAITVVAAADLDDNYNREVRAQLLKACGL